MAFVLRRPFAITTALKQIPKPTTTPSTSVLRTFHTSPKPSAQIPRKPTSASLSSLVKHGFRSGGQRTYAQPATYTQRPDMGGSLGSKLLYGGAIVGGTMLATNLLFNRETREDGGMPPFERAYLNETFLHTGLGVGMIGVVAKALHSTGWSFRLMSMNPWLVMGGGLVASIGSMMGCFATDPDNYVQKYALWSVFNASQAALLSPLLFMQPAILARAGLYTVAMMGSIAFVGATAKQEKYLYLGGPLLAGVAIVAVSGFAPLVLPATAARTLMWSERIWLYGGLAVFGGFTLYDVQKVLRNARLAQNGVVKRDAVNESISLELDFLNIFIRMVQILGMNRNR
ncbi:MAG: hypothetical protein Q9191_004435, partial [Dirinaria sp. TL-2023a]